MGVQVGLGEEKRTNRWFLLKLLVIGGEPAPLHHVWLLLIETQTEVQTCGA